MIGEMRHRIVLANPTVTVSGTGGSTTNYVTFATVWAKKKKANYKQDQTHEAGQSKILDEVEFEIRHSSTVEANLSKDTRVTHDSINYSIVDYQNVEDKNFYYKIKAKALKV